MKLFNKLLKTLKDIYNDRNLFLIEKKVLKFVGFWPSEINIWRIIFFTLLDFCFTTVPISKLFIQCLVTNDYKCSALATPEFLMSVIHTFALIIFSLEVKVIKHFLEKLENEWFNDESADWEIIRNKCMLFGNRASLLNNLVLQFAGIFYYMVPQIVFVFNSYIFNDSSKLVEKPMDRGLAFMAE